MTSATTLEWRMALNGWSVARTTFNDKHLCILKKGRTVAVPASQFAAALGLKPNRFMNITYAERMRGKLVDLHVGSGIGSYRAGVAKCIYLTQIHPAMSACNIRRGSKEYKALMALLEQVRDSEPESTPEPAPIPMWCVDEEAARMWGNTLTALREISVPLAAMLKVSAHGFSYHRGKGIANISVCKSLLELLKRREETLNRALTEAHGCPMKAVLFAGEAGRGFLAHLKPDPCAVPMASPPLPPSDPQPAIPFVAEEDPEPSEEELDAALADASDRDLLNALGSLAAGIDKRVEELAEDFDALERKLDKYALLTARRNRMLSQILEGLAEVMGANLCTPEEHVKGTWRGNDD